MLVLLRENPYSLSAARCFIDRCDDSHVATPELARHWSVAAGENTVGKVIYLRRLLIDRREVQQAATGFSHDPAIGKGVLLEFNPTLCAFGAKSISILIEARDRVAFGPIPKLHRPADCFFDFVKEFGLSFWLLVRGHENRRRAISRHAGAVHNVDSQVHHWSATAKFLVDAPSALAENESAVAGHFHEGAKFLLARQAHQLLVIQVVMQSIANGQFHFRRLARSDHSITISNGCCHRLFGDDVLAGFGGANHKLWMQRRWSDDVNDIDVFVVSNPIERLVAVNVFAVQAKVGGPLLAFFRMTCDHAGEMTQLCLTQSRTQLACRVST